MSPKTAFNDFQVARVLLGGLENVSRQKAGYGAQVSGCSFGIKIIAHESGMILSAYRVPVHSASYDEWRAPLASFIVFSAPSDAASI